MNKQELVAVIAEKTNETKTKTAQVLETILSTIQEELASGNDVVITNFGKFSTTQRAARTGRNPQTGEAIQIAAKVSPKFKAGKQLRESMA